MGFIKSTLNRMVGFGTASTLSVLPVAASNLLGRGLSLTQMAGHVALEAIGGIAATVTMAGVMGTCAYSVYNEGDSSNRKKALACLVGGSATLMLSCAAATSTGIFIPVVSRGIFAGKILVTIGGTLIGENALIRRDILDLDEATCEKVKKCTTIAGNALILVGCLPYSSVGGLAYALAAGVSSMVVANGLYSLVDLLDYQEDIDI